MDNTNVVPMIDILRSLWHMIEALQKDMSNLEYRVMQLEDNHGDTD